MPTSLRVLAACACLALAALVAAPGPSAADAPFDARIAVEASIPERVDFFSPKVFDHRFYLRHNNLTHPGRAASFTSKEARQHWASVGLKTGLRASPLFWSKAYLEHNVDVRDRYGEDNYPMAVVHFLQKGVNETWRETGGPRRAAIFDESVFQWQWYAAKYPELHLHTEEAAKAHWRDHGIEDGRQASPHISLRAYLEKNRDLRVMFGPTNYAAALAYFVDHGHLETWRPNGGETCRFWATWCQTQTASELAKSGAPAAPVYNSSGVPYDPNFQAPIPQSAGYDVTINGVDCAELAHKAEPRASYSRVEKAYHLHFRGLAGVMRPCTVYVRHYVDLQTRTQDSAPDALSLRHWSFDDSVPAAAMRQPLNITHTSYEGYSWYQKPASRPQARGTVDPSLERLAINYTVTSFIMADPSVDSGEAQKRADREALPPRTLWSLQHHFVAKPGAPAGVGTPWGESDPFSEMDEEERRALHAKLNTFYQPPHTPYKNVPLGKNYYVSSGVIPYWEQNQEEREAFQKSRERETDEALQEGLNTADE